MKTEKITLDGKHNGFRAYLINEDEFLKNENGLLVQMRSLVALKSLLYSYGYYNPYDYKIWIIDNNLKLEIDFDDVEYVNDHYEYYDEKNNIRYDIIDNRVDKITLVGYFAFDGGNQVGEKMATKDGQKISKKYYAEIKDSLDLLVKRPDEKPHIETVYKDKVYKNLCCSVTGSSVNIRFLYNWDFVNLNNQRKEKNIRCIPYLKTVDRYKTIIVLAMRNTSDHISAEIEEDMIHKILEEINKTGQQVEYIPVEFKGTIINEEVN